LLAVLMDMPRCGSCSPNANNIRLALRSIPSDPPLEQVQTVKVTLKFDHAGTVDVEYPVAAIGCKVDLPVIQPTQFELAINLKNCESARPYNPPGSTCHRRRGDRM